MNKQKVLVVLSVVGLMATVIGIVVQGQGNEEEWQRTLVDWEVMDKGVAVSDQFWNAYFNFGDEKITAEEYVKIKLERNRIEKEVIELTKRISYLI